MERAQRLRCGKQTKTEWWDKDKDKTKDKDEDKDNLRLFSLPCCSQLSLVKLSRIDLRIDIII